MTNKKCRECGAEVPLWIIVTSNDLEICKICVLLGELKNQSEKIEDHNVKIEKIELDMDMVTGKLNETNIYDNNKSKGSSEIEDIGLQNKSIGSREIDFSGFVNEEDLKLDIKKKEMVSKKSIIKGSERGEEEELNSFKREVNGMIREGLKEIREINFPGEIENKISESDMTDKVAVSKEPKLVLKNRFSPLEEDNGEEEQSEYCVLGDSIVKHFEKKTRRRKQRSIYCDSGAGMERLIEHIENGNLGGRAVVLQGGGNDIEKVNTERLMKLFKEAIEKVRSKGKICLVSGILPRQSESRYWSSKAIGINNRVQKLCSEIDGAMFLDNWEKFYHNRRWYTRDGIHLNYQGSKVLSNIVDAEVELNLNLLESQCKQIIT